MIQDIPKVGRVYQLNPGTVSPTRPAGRDKNGIPREETMMVLAKYAHFIDTSGNDCKVALQCGRVFSQEPEAERIELQRVRDQLNAGCLPLNECPHTQKYMDIIPGLEDGRLVPLPEGASPAHACTGKKMPADWPAGVRFMGCEHMEVVIKNRLAVSHATWLSQQSESEATKMLAAARAVGEGIAGALPGGDARKRMANGKGE